MKVFYYPVLGVTPPFSLDPQWKAMTTTQHSTIMILLLVYVSTLLYRCTWYITWYQVAITMYPRNQFDASRRGQKGLESSRD